MSRLLRVSICALGLRGREGFGASQYDLEKNLGLACDMVRQAAAEGADLAVLPEVCVVQNRSNGVEGAEPLDGQVVTTFAKAARDLGVGIAFGHPTIEDGKRYNSIVLVGRDGRVAGVYHKAYPTIWELEEGIAPGEGAVVLDTEFGRLGFAICYDLNFAELRLAYRDLAPEAILFCSAFRGGLQTRWWAYETRAYLVSSCIDPKSVIVNPLGRVIDQTDSYTRLTTRTLDLDFEVVHYDYTNVTLDEVRARLGGALDFEWAEPEGVMLVTARGERSASSIVTEAGWEPVEAYFARSRTARERAVKGEAIEKGPAPW